MTFAAHTDAQLLEAFAGNCMRGASYTRDGLHTLAAACERQRAELVSEGERRGLSAAHFDEYTFGSEARCPTASRP